MRQVLLNIITNALKYSPKGGLLTLESEFTVDSRHLAVEDEGPGVPADQQERIFERFVRIDPEATAPAGSGLGLAICRSIIALHGGVIRAETGQRKGGLRVVAEIPLSSSLDWSKREVTASPETEEVPPQGAKAKPDGDVDH
jgi:two-component system heavy metal sensor histidine kinase CusS